MSIYIVFLSTVYDVTDVSVGPFFVYTLLMKLCKYAFFTRTRAFARTDRCSFEKKVKQEIVVAR